MAGSAGSPQAEREARLREALLPFAKAYERAVAGDVLWPVTDQQKYRAAYKAYRGATAGEGEANG